MVFLRFDKNNWNTIGKNAESRVQSVLTGGYRFRINDNLNLLPGIYASNVKSAPIDFQFQAIIDIQSKFNIGLGYRNTDALILFLGTSLGQKNENDV